MYVPWSLNSFLSKYKKTTFYWAQNSTENCCTCSESNILQAQYDKQVSVECIIIPKFYGT